MPATLDTPTLDAMPTDRHRSAPDRLADAGRLILLAGPTALAFFAGGYFDGPRAWAGVAAWLVVVVIAVASRRVIPGGTAGRPARLALVALALFAAWTLLSTTWAPVAGTAYHDGQRVVLYAGALLGAAALLRTRAAQRAVEPALAMGTLIVIGYGLSERLLPGLLHFARSVSAEGRLEQPLTYWNAMGELAALGFVLATRLGGDRTRPAAVRMAAAGGAPALGLGLYISFSRGALFACVAGLVTLIVVAPQRSQARAIAITLTGGVLASLVAAPLTGITAMGGSISGREGDGAIMLVALVVIGSLAAVAQRRWGGTRTGAGLGIDDDARLPLPARTPLLATLVICAGLALAIVLGAHETSAQPLQGGSARLVSLQSNRYAYWRVALRAFGQEPLRGVGAGGWAVDWLRWRPFAEGAQDAHSLELQTLAELGLVGLALLAAFLAGVGLAARAAHRIAPGAAAGAIAGCVVWLAHSPLDWDWEMPAVTVIALILAGALLALPEAYGEPAASARSGRERRSGAAARRPALAAAPLRWLLALGAAVLCAWFVLGTVQAHNEDAATSLLDRSGTPSPALTSRILNLLDTAGTLNPDRDIALMRSQAQSRAGQSAAAVRTARAAARAEPLNIDAWTVLAFAAQSADPAETKLARAEQAKLAPPVPSAP